MAPRACWSERGEHIHVTRTVMELCLGTTDSLEIPLSRIFPPRSSSGGSSHAPSLAFKGLGMQGMRKAGSKELYQHPAARHPLAPLKRCARKPGLHWCQTALKRSQGRRHPQTVFSPWDFSRIPCKPLTQPWISAQVQVPLGAPTHPCVPKQPGMPKPPSPVPAGAPHRARRDGIFLGISDILLT